MQSIKEEKIVPLNEVSNFRTAFHKAQQIMTGAKKGSKNPFFGNNYADLASVFEAVREPFLDNDICITQTMDVLPDGKQVLKTSLLHLGGESLESTMLLPIETNPQKLGSLISYYKRYALLAIAGIPTSDDDGNKASAKKPPASRFINDKHVEQLESLINGHNDIRESVLENCSGNIRTMTVDRFPGAMRWIKELIEEKAAINA